MSSLSGPGQYALGQALHSHDDARLIAETVAAGGQEPVDNVAELTDSSGGTPAATLQSTLGIEVITIPLTSLATGLSTSAIDLLTTLTLGFAFQLLEFDFVTTIAGTGSGASQTFNLAIGSTATTGGVLNPTLSSTDTIGKKTLGSAITALNTGAKTDTISIKMAASGTVFTAGGGYFIIKLRNMDTVNAFSSLNASIDAILESLIAGNVMAGS